IHSAVRRQSPDGNQSGAGAADRITVTVKTTIRKACSGTALPLVLLAGIAGVAPIGAATGQTLQADNPDTPQGTIDIPQNVQLLGKNDPNVRRATAVVSGDVITGTDVDQRLALVL